MSLKLDNFFVKKLQDNYVYGKVLVTKQLRTAGETVVLLGCKMNELSHQEFGMSKLDCLFFFEITVAVNICECR